MGENHVLNQVSDWSLQNISNSYLDGLKYA